MQDLNEVTTVLKDKLPEDGFLDVGEGAAKMAGVSIVKLRTALATLREEGYKIWRVPLQNSEGHATILKLLGTPDTTLAEAQQAVVDRSIAHLIR
jgi:hypothetical protein